MRKKPDILVFILLGIWVVAIISAFYNHTWLGAAVTIVPVMIMAMLSKHNLNPKSKKDLDQDKKNSENP